MVTVNQLRDGYNRLNRRLIVGAGDISRQIFENLGSWRDEDVPRFQSLLFPQLDGIKQQAAQLQATYYAEVSRIAGEDFTPQSVPASDLTTESLRNGAPSDEVYRRPFATVHAELAKGSLVSEAIALGGARALQLASTDVQLAGRLAGFAQRMGNERIRFYRRTLTGAENCALCAIASTQRYRRGDLKPIHPGCDCGEEPFYGDETTPQIIDPNRLFETHEAIFAQLGVNDPSARDAGIGKVIESSEGPKLADFTELIVNREHGEYGPTITFRDQNFTSLQDIAES